MGAEPIEATGLIADGSITTANLADGSVTSATIADGAIVDADVSPTAAIACSKPNLANSIVGSDLVSAANYAISSTDDIVAPM